MFLHFGVCLFSLVLFLSVVCADCGHLLLVIGLRLGQSVRIALLQLRNTLRGYQNLIHAIQLRSLREAVPYSLSLSTPRKPFLSIPEWFLRVVYYLSSCFWRQAVSNGGVGVEFRAESCSTVGVMKFRYYTQEPREFPDSCRDTLPAPCFELPYGSSVVHFNCGNGVFMRGNKFHLFSQH